MAAVEIFLVGDETALRAHHGSSGEPHRPLHGPSVDDARQPHDASRTASSPCGARPWPARATLSSCSSPCRAARCGRLGRRRPTTRRTASSDSRARWRAPLARERVDHPRILRRGRARQRHGGARRGGDAMSAPRAKKAEAPDECAADTAPDSRRCPRSRQPAARVRRSIPMLTGTAAPVPQTEWTHWTHWTLFSVPSARRSRSNPLKPRYFWCPETESNCRHEDFQSTRRSGLTLGNHELMADRSELLQRRCNRRTARPSRRDSRGARGGSNGWCLGQKLSGGRTWAP